MNHERPDLGWVWLGALGCFILAASTGVLFRFGLLNGFPAGLQMVDIRHAHSHLMYFGWVTPVLMALIVKQLPRVTGQAVRTHTGFQRVIGLTLILALLAFPPFLLFGYRLAEIGERQLPLSVMAASLNILAWYVFVGLYIRASWRLPRRLSLRLWDASLAFLVLASLGAWGRGVLVAVGVEDPFWQAAMVHLFLVGWVTQLIIGVAYWMFPKYSRDRPRPTHIEFLLLGWILQLAMGVAYWILPRSRGTRGREEAAWLAFFLLNVGVWLAGVGPALNASGWVRAAGRLSELSAVLAFGSHAWPRVKPLGT